MTADLAFDVNLLYSLKRSGFSILEVPTEWTDKIGSKVTQTLMRSSLVMFLSVVRLRLIYSPFYPWLRKPLGPIADGFTRNSGRQNRGRGRGHTRRRTKSDHLGEPCGLNNRFVIGGVLGAAISSCSRMAQVKKLQTIR